MEEAQWTEKRRSTGSVGMSESNVGWMPVASAPRMPASCCGAGIIRSSSGMAASTFTGQGARTYGVHSCRRRACASQEPAHHWRTLSKCCSVLADDFGAGAKRRSHDPDARRHRRKWGDLPLPEKWGAAGHVQRGKSWRLASSAASTGRHRVPATTTGTGYLSQADTPLNLTENNCLTD
jgi:hypothetical protein